jgi:hypothetical protein
MARAGSGISLDGVACTVTAISIVVRRFRSSPRRQCAADYSRLIVRIEKGRARGRARPADSVGGCRYVLRMFDPVESLPSLADVLDDPGAVARWAATARPGPDTVELISMLEAAAVDADARIDLLMAVERQCAWLTAVQQKVLASLEANPCHETATRTRTGPKNKWVPRCGCRRSRRNVGLGVARQLATRLTDAAALLAPAGPDQLSACGPARRGGRGPRRRGGGRRCRRGCCRGRSRRRSGSSRKAWPGRCWRRTRAAPSSGMRRRTV